MKKTSKIIVALLIAITIIMISATVFAEEITPRNFSAIAPSNTSAVTNMGGRIIGVVRTIGVLIAVVILLVLGIKYMMGSAEEKADYKKSMIPYLVGAVLIFAGSTIAGLVYDMVISLNKQ